ncbi:MAG: AMP-binding protein [Pseudomonadota bacterium]
MGSDPPPPLVASGEVSISLEQLRQRAACAATGLAQSGVGEGDVVAAFLRNDLPLLELLEAGPIAGAYVAPINWHLRGTEVAAILADCRPKLMVIHADLLAAVADALPPDLPRLVVPTPEHIAAAYAIDPAICRPPPGARLWEEWREAHAPWQGPPRTARTSLIYTSGTTGTPKGVARFVREQAADTMMVDVRRKVFGLRPGATGAVTGPLYHSAVGAFASTCLATDTSLFLTPRFDPEGLLDLIDRRRITHMHMVPTMFVRLVRLPDAVKQRYDLRSLECVIHGAAPCPVEVKRQMIDWWGPIFQEYYGSTEAGLVTLISSAEALERPGSTGRPVGTCALRILGNDGHELPTGAVGEVFVRNPAGQSFTYFGDPTLKAQIERDGWITNGDIGCLDEAGYLFLRDRAKDMIISGGVNIFPSEIEEVIRCFPNVRECAVFGIPDEEFGEAIAAAVELDDPEIPLDTEALKAFVADELARYKAPKRIDVHDRLAREDSGKIYKRKLREPFWQHLDRRI